MKDKKTCQLPHIFNIICHNFQSDIVQKAYVKIHLRARLHGDGGPQAGEANCLCGIKNNPPLHAILQTRHPGVHFLKIIEWSLTARKQEKYWQTTCFGD